MKLLNSLMDTYMGRALIGSLQAILFLFLVCCISIAAFTWEPNPLEWPIEHWKFITGLSITLGVLLGCRMAAED